MSKKEDAVVSEQHAMIGNVTQDAAPAFQRNDHPDAQWFASAGLGLFLHFGISAVRGECDLSWGMIKNDSSTRENAVKSYGLFNLRICMRPSDYWAMAKDFVVDAFDPVTILTAAKEAGCKYAVLTTKHHDGFCLWPSAFGGFHIGNYQPGRDIVREYVDACREVGLKVGLYYSPPDWYFNRNRMSFHYGKQQPPLDVNHEPVNLPDGVTIAPSEGGRPAYLPVQSEEENKKQDEEYDALVRGQTLELITNYGPIDVLWYDGAFPNGEETLSVEEMRKLQPSMLFNPRALGYGDFDTSECRFPDKRHRGWWEYCHVSQDGGWGYREHDGYKPVGWLLAELVKARAWGGNFLPNFAPDAHGQMPAGFYKRMQQIQSWMQKHAESVFDVEPGPWPERSDAPVTIRGKTWYVHFDYLNEGQATLTGVGKAKSATMLATGEAVLFEQQADNLIVRIPEPMRTTFVDVVAVTFE